MTITKTVKMDLLSPGADTVVKAVQGDNCSRLLSDAMLSFHGYCVAGIRADRKKMHQNLHNSLMLVTALNPHIGYENTARVAKKAYKENTSLQVICTPNTGHPVLGVIL